MNEKEKEQPRALRTHDGEPQTPIPFYSGLKDSYKEKGGEWTNAIDCMAFEAWKKCTPVKKVKLVAAVKSGAHFKPRLDWLISDFPEPRPEVISADEYYKRYETTEELDGWRREYRPEERRSVYIKEP